MRSYSLFGLAIAILVPIHSLAAPAPLYKGPASQGSPPLAELYTVSRDKDRPRALQMSWRVEATEAGTAIRSVSLHWAKQKSGPWHAIADRIVGAETTNCSWSPSADVPLKVYLRLTARDSADNTSVAQTPELYPLPQTLE